MELKFHTLDVFTRTRFGGNPLAVVMGADGLSAEMMQTIAAEFNLSETVFVMKPERPAHSAKAPYFHAQGGIAVRWASDRWNCRVAWRGLRAVQTGSGREAMVVLEENIGRRAGRRSSSAPQLVRGHPLPSSDGPKDAGEGKQVCRT